MEELRGAVDGPVVTYARVGEEAYHVWECDSDMFGMLVHSCFVDDGQGQQRSTLLPLSSSPPQPPLPPPLRFQLLDQSGCAIDPVILTDLQYNDAGNQAFVEAHVFKYVVPAGAVGREGGRDGCGCRFADRVSTYFQCAISLCMRSDGACEGMTPPRCQGGGSGDGEASSARFRREIRASNASKHSSAAAAGRRDSDADLDVAAERIIVLDIDDRVEEDEAREELGSQTRLVETTGLQTLPTFRFPAAPYSVHQICLSPYGFGVLLAIFLLIFSSALATVCVQCWRQRSLPTLKA